MVSTAYFPGSLAAWHRHETGIQLQTQQGSALHLIVITPHILRFRFSPDGMFERDFSYAPDPAWTPGPVAFQVRETQGYLFVSTQAIRCRIEKATLRVNLYDAAGRLILADEKGFHWTYDELTGQTKVLMHKKARKGETYWGLGDKTGPLNLRGQAAENWCHDSFAFGTGTDPIYRAIPFYYGLHHGLGYGIFFDNSFRTRFDFARTQSSVTRFEAPGGEMNYYFIQGPELLRVAERYTHLTGRHELPPQWALGFHQSRWSYFPDTRVREIADTFRTLDIPCDAIYLDIDYMEGYRCFTWDLRRFPDPAGLIRELEEMGIKTVVIIDPGIKVDPEYEVFRQGLAMDAYLRTADGPYARGKVWPGECFFPDFTQADVRDWWGSLHRDLIRKAGVHGVWNDMNEPAVFDVPSKTLPEDVRFHYDGHPCSHRKAHNIYGMQMSRATREGLRDLAYPRRPFVITRATYAGGQRYAAVWTGDNVASWDHLRLAVTQCQRLSVSGFSFVGSDIGGFVDNSDGELLVRWLQAALFHPLYRMHSMGFNVAGDDSVDDDAVAANQSSGRVQDQEPWSFGEPFTALAREAIRLRYRLLPALYTAFWQYSQFGTPMLRPLLFEDLTLGAAGHHGQTFLAGDHLLLSPVTACGELIHTTLLPTGVWYDLQTGTAYAGPGEITTRVYLHDIPMYLRAGGVLPMGPVRRNTAEPVTGPLTLHIALGTSPTASCYYEDAGEGYAYQDGQYRLHRFEVSGAGGRYEVSQTTEGSAAPAYTTLVIQLYGAGNQAPVITCEGQLYTPARTRAGWEVVGIPVGFSTLRVEARTNETV